MGENISRASSQSWRLHLETTGHQRLKPEALSSRSPSADCGLLRWAIRRATSFGTTPAHDFAGVAGN
jgi:hypothetical protein